MMKIVKGKKPSPRRCLLYGPHGVGKSTWAASAPASIFINLEDGLNDIDVSATEHLLSIQQVMDSLQWLTVSEHKFRTLVIDTVDWLEHLIHKDVANHYSVKNIGEIDWGKGYSRATWYWQQVLATLDHLRKARSMAVILLGHSRIVPVKTPEGLSFDRYEPDLHSNAKGEGSSSLVQEWCDEVLFANFRLYTSQQNKRDVARGGKERFIKTSESGSCLAKNRIGLPDELPMDFAAYASAIKTSRNMGQQNVIVDDSPEVKMDGDLLADSVEIF
jgi:hypothetical protein